MDRPSTCGSWVCIAMLNSSSKMTLSMGWATESRPAHRANASLCLFLRLRPPGTLSLWNCRGVRHLSVRGHAGPDCGSKFGDPRGRSDLSALTHRRAASAGWHEGRVIGWVGRAPNIQQGSQVHRDAAPSNLAIKPCFRCSRERLAL